LIASAPKPKHHILCDINLPGMNGFEFKSEIDNDFKLMEKSIPFIFFSTAATKPIVTEAYTKMTVQGFFQKNDNIEELKYSLKTIIEYWKLCKHPNGSFD
jgi:CheY-like chemotaxis protein